MGFSGFINTVILIILTVSSFADTLMADPRATSIAALACNSTTVTSSTTLFVENFVSTFERLSQKVNKSGFGSTKYGQEPNAVYGLVQCYKDLSSTDCRLCYAELRTLLPTCFPMTGGRVFLDGCFGRFESYYFFDQGVDSVVRKNCSSRKNIYQPNRFGQVLKNVVGNVSLNAQESNGFAVGSDSVSNFSVYALAQCWDSLDKITCESCLQAAASSIMSCSPAVEGRWLNAGCYMRYSTEVFWTIEKSSGNESNLPKLLIGIGVGIIAALFISITICCFQRRVSSNNLLVAWKRNRKNDQNVEAIIREHGSLAPKRYSYSDIKKITYSFRDKLGQGGYGGVYKGKLPDCRLVAVKVLKETKGNGEEFINEVASISRTSHVNVVTLLGFCFEGHKRALIYEFMPNGSLEKFIYDGNSSIMDERRLGWEKLYQIAIGIARGLEYLHLGCNTRILHFDIKPHNILLDEDFCPKIADFGLAKLCLGKESIISMLGARGTIGYIAPEVYNRNFGRVSHKSDVYSYGSMILEMVGGRKKNINVGVSQTSEKYFPHWVYKRLEIENEFILEGVMTEEDNEIARKMLLVGLWCIQTDPSQRPSMSKVMDMLEGSIEALQIPPKPFLSSPSRPPVNSSTPSTTSVL